MNDLSLVLLTLVVGLPLYFVPTIVAFKRRNQNRIPILFTNLIFGWAFMGLGWIGCLLWACLDKQGDV